MIKIIHSPNMSSAYLGVYGCDDGKGPVVVDIRHNKVENLNKIFILLAKWLYCNQTDNEKVSI